MTAPPKTAFLATLLAIFFFASAGAGEGDAAPCTSREQDPIDKLVDALQSDQVCVPRDPTSMEKKPKTYPTDWPPARRRGLNQVLTTFYNVHSREAVPVYVNRPIPDEILDHLFRCRGFAYHKRLDPRLVETVLAAVREFEAKRVKIISAYRSPKFNDALAKKARRVARESKHTRGEAIDFALVGVTAAKLGRWLWDNFDGGVGTYRSDGFCHIDVGPKRRWAGK